MKKKIITLGLLTMMFGQVALAQTVFSPRVNGLRSNYQAHSAVVTRGEVFEEHGFFVVTCSPSASTAEIANKMIELGGELRVLMGNQLVVDLPMSRLDSIAAIDGVLLVDVPPVSKDKTDLVRKVSHVDEIHAGTGLPQAYTGKGVIIGLIDMGYDYTHPMFKDKDGNLRIKAVYRPGEETLRDAGEPLTNIPVVDEKGISTALTLTGEFITNSDIILDTLKMKDAIGSHGTHCASIAAGRHMDGADGVKGVEGTGYLGGMAPEADILLGTTNATEEQIKKYHNLASSLRDYNAMQSLYAMKHYAAQQNKPLVVSWSQNSHDGFHDGTSTKARYVANYCRQGNVMALCAGNEGEEVMYVRRKINKGKTVAVKTVSTSYNGDIFALIKTSKEIKVDLSVVDSDNNTVYVCNLPLTSAGTNDYEKEFMSGVEYDEKNEKIWKYNKPYYADNGPQGRLLPYLKQGNIYLEIGKGTGLDANDQPFDFVRINLTCRNFDTEKDASGYYYNFVFHVTSVEEDVIMQSWGDDYSQYATTMDEPNKFIAGQSEYSVGDWNTSGEPVTIGAYAANIKKFDSNGALVESSYEKVGRYASFRLVDGTLFADGAPDGTPVSLYNLQGVCVAKTTVQGGAVSVAGLAKGVYAVQLGRLGSTLIRK